MFWRRRIISQFLLYLAFSRGLRIAEPNAAAQMALTAPTSECTNTLIGDACNRKQKENQNRRKILFKVSLSLPLFQASTECEWWPFAPFMEFRFSATSMWAVHVAERSWMLSIFQSLTSARMNIKFQSKVFLPSNLWRRHESVVHQTSGTTARQQRVMRIIETTLWMKNGKI